MISRPQQQSRPDALLSRPRLRAARLSWLAVALLCVGLFVLAIPARLEQLRQPAADTVLSTGQLDLEDQQELEEMGVSPARYAIYFTVVESVSAFAFVLVGSVVFWRRSDTLMGLFLSLALISVGTGYTPLRAALVWKHPAWEWPVNFLTGFYALSFFSFFLLFPSGRFVPRWTRWAAAVFAVYTVAWLIYPSIRPPLALASPNTRAQFVSALWNGSALLFGIYAQVYRYTRVSGTVERQQTRWVVFGFLAALVVISAVSLPILLGPAGVAGLGFRLVAINVVLLGITFLPVTIGISILRHKLFDIDLLINRALVYGALTVTLALLYLVSVVALQSAFRRLTGQGDQLAIVASTLLIAALFTPARRRLQSGIDRRFYRSRYDAQKVLATFAATARDEVDLNRLTERLVEVVQETMQPAHVSLWLRETADDSRQAAFHSAR